MAQTLQSGSGIARPVRWKIVAGRRCRRAGVPVWNTISPRMDHSYINSLLVANQCKLYAPPSGPGKDVPGIIVELKKFAAERNIPKGEMIMGYGFDDTVMPDCRLVNRNSRAGEEIGLISG